MRAGWTLHTRNASCLRRACVALLVVAASLVSAAAADAPWLYGIHFYGDPAQSDVETMTGGKGIYSLEVVLTDSDPWWGAVHQRDVRFNHMVAQGHTIICRIQPQWDFAIPKAPDYDMADYLTKVTQAATVLSDTVHIWHVGNEMNLFAEYDGDVLTPEEYVAAFVQIRDAIKAVPSSLGEQIVLLGPVSPGPADGFARHTDGSEYLARMCAAIDETDLDGFAIHAYGAPWFPAPMARQDLLGGYLAQICVIEHYGFHDEPVYITEWNRATSLSQPSDEANTAQFLHGAFVDLHAWNQRPRAHPISAACWFIYQYDDAVWNQYSLGYLHTIGDPGPDNDVWDAFQYACTLDLPTAQPSPGGHPPRAQAAPPPGANIAPQSTLSVDSGDDTAPAVVDGVIEWGSRWNSGGGAPVHWLQLDFDELRMLSGYTVYHTGMAGAGFELYNTQSWFLESAPTATGPWTIEDMVYNTANHTPRTFNVPLARQHLRLYVLDPGRDAYARILEFELNAITRGDFDENETVDLADVAAFQACFTGTATQATGGCLWAHFDEDGDVDTDDLAGFAAALTGP